jgi:hypothetical protein
MSQQTHTQYRPTGDTDATGLSSTRLLGWTGALLAALSGALLVLGGSLLFEAADPAAIASLVADGSIRSDVLPDAELADLTYALARWGGIGLFAAGGLVLLSSLGFLFLGRRATTAGAAWPNAYLGAVATLLLSSIPGAAFFGGLVAGYLQSTDREAATKAGALSGVLAAVPVLVAVGVVAVGAGSVATGFDEVTGVVALGLVVAFVAVVGVGFNAVLGALGGYLAPYLAE